MEINLIKNILNAYVSFNNSELDMFKGMLNLKMLKKNDYFIRESESVNKIGIVVEGILELFHIDEFGNEISIDFAFPNSFTTDYVNYLSNTSSSLNIRAIKPSKVYVLNKSDLDVLYEKSIQFQKLGRIIAEQSFVEFAKRIRNSSLPPEIQYNNLITEKQHWIQQIPQYKLASYLNISPEWLSKLRSKK